LIERFQYAKFDPNLHCHSYGDGHTASHRHPHIDAHGQQHTGCHKYANKYTFTHSFSHVDPHADRDAERQRYPDHGRAGALLERCVCLRRGWEAGQIGLQ
jgi:hypothetical protein